jgi:hypothetical protein
MDETERPHPPQPEHETRDVNVRAVTKAGLAIGAGVIVSIFLMWFLFDQFAGWQAQRAELPEPIAAVNPQKEPPEPRLQSAPVKDLAAFRAQEDAILNSYGWVDREKGIVRIPVDRAMEVVAKEGLPVRKQENK